jgi:hypothetical protein
MFSIECNDNSSIGSSHKVFVITLIFRKIIQMLDHLKNYKYLKNARNFWVNKSSVFNIHPYIIASCLNKSELKLIQIYFDIPQVTPWKFQTQ